MKKNLLLLSAIVLFLSLGACSDGKKSAKSVAQEWCDLNGKVAKAADGPDKEAARATLKKWEDKMEAKYKGDEAFKDEMEKEAEKCEAASEGR
ncbi:MAG: hypothetical protein LH619_07590 [Chitinophagaceae bacterium]|nr:hypothetical protein [Chitinophagaceae bacterium]